MSDRQKITEAHRRRRAVVYVRHSTPTQVQEHGESRARQYALRERAIELGWPEAQVAVVDGDLGRSGASAEGRIGFKELVVEVGLGQVGGAGARASRLARCSADWHQLLDLCALTGTLLPTPTYDVVASPRGPIPRRKHPPRFWAGADALLPDQPDSSASAGIRSCPGWSISH